MDDSSPIHFKVSSGVHIENITMEKGGDLFWVSRGDNEKWLNLNYQKSIRNHINELLD